ncbi:MAG: 2-C-methyl-D-erythritol 4-phosphate cytidylyltransferase [Deltaproteobacteria bacterium GWA2_45_12]|nr:MAG: 2-C-methyl-D-erythritol 4-phosphate cytidylyltransferase [Deltaproteobacteria bacterium GWA2_45_12]
MSNYAIIPAAGLGIRFGGQTRKQFLELKGKPLFQWSVEAFVKTGLFEKIVVCLPAQGRGDPAPTVGVGFPDPCIFITGGATRAESVKKGFEFLHSQDDDTVLVHDAVRPLVSVDLIKKIVEATKVKWAVVPVVPISDTVKEMDGDKVKKTIPRNQLRLTQTPQGFSCRILSALYKSHPDLGQNSTDEAMMVEGMGTDVFVVEGDPKNIKVTTPDDLKLAEYYLNSL